MGVVAAAVPVAAGLKAYLAPLRRKSRESEMVRVAMLSALPIDGTPRRFPVIATRADAWNRSETMIGAVYLRQLAGGRVQALNVVCPHAGCFVDYAQGENAYFCPCHQSSFALDGRINDPKSPAPRGLDALEVEIREGQEVWVKFQNFRTGEAKKIPA